MKVRHSLDRSSGYAKEPGPDLCRHRRAGFSLILPLLPYFRRPAVGHERSDPTLHGLAFTVFQTVFALFAQIRLALDAQATGYVFSYVGLRIVAIQGDGIGLLENPID
jgi:hypothetical protein